MIRHCKITNKLEVQTRRPGMYMPPFKQTAGTWRPRALGLSRAGGASCSWLCFSRSWRFSWVLCRHSKAIMSWPWQYPTLIQPHIHYHLRSWPIDIVIPALNILFRGKLNTSDPSRGDWGLQLLQHSPNVPLQSIATSTCNIVQVHIYTGKPLLPGIETSIINKHKKYLPNKTFHIVYGPLYHI